MSSILVYLRGAARLLAIVMVTAVIHSWIRARQILNLGAWRRRRPTDLVGLWGRALCRIMGIRVFRRNERSGELGSIVVSNHLGFLDIPVLLSIYPAVFIIKDEIGHLRFSGKALKNQGHIFVKRDDQDSRNQAGRALGEAIENGDRVIVFPEGRANSAAKRLPYQPFSFFEAKRQNKAVEVVALDYLPDRNQMVWNPDKSMFVQFLGLLGRPRHEVSIEFLTSEVPKNPREDAKRWREAVEQRLSC